MQYVLLVLHYKNMFFLYNHQIHFHLMDNILLLLYNLLESVIKMFSKLSINMYTDTCIYEYIDVCVSLSFELIVIQHSVNIYDYLICNHIIPWSSDLHRVNVRKCFLYVQHVEPYSILYANYTYIIHYSTRCYTTVLYIINDLYTICMVYIIQNIPLSLYSHYSSMVLNKILYDYYHH